MQFKIVSLNLAGFKDWETRLQKIINFLNEKDPDILLLQEVKFDPLVSAYSQSIQLNQLLQKPFPFSQTTVSKFYQPSIGDAFREGLAVLSKYPIAHSEALVLAKQTDDKHSRIIQNADLLINTQQIGISNIHLSNNKHSTAQLRELLGIFRSRTEQRIIAGDFNIFDLEGSNDLYAEDYTSSMEFKEYISFPSEKRTLDYALVPKKYAINSLETYEGFSDHSALLFTLMLPA